MVLLLELHWKFESLGPGDVDVWGLDGISRYFGNAIQMLTITGMVNKIMDNLKPTAHQQEQKRDVRFLEEGGD